MRAFPFAAVVLTLASCLAVAGELSEERAVQMVRQLPEFVSYAKTREQVIDDNELITDRTELQLPAVITLPAWRIDVHTVIHDGVTDHLSLWHRFIVPSSGEIYVWRPPPENRFNSLTEWRKLRKK